MNFHSLTFLLWAGVMVAQIVLCAILHAGASYRNYPAFTAYSYAAVAAGIASVATAFYGNPVQFLVYSVLSGTMFVLMVMVVAEEYVAIFGPRHGLPAWVPRDVLTLIGTALALTTAIVAIFRPLNGGPLTRALAKGEIGFSVALLAFFVGLLVYSHRIGLTPRRRPQGIATGFILYLAISAATLFVQARIPLRLTPIAIQIRLASYVVTLLWWGVVLWGKEPVPEKATEAEVEEVLLVHNRNMEAAART